MKLLDYLQANFLTVEELLDQTGIDLDRLRELQQKECMPACSYRLSNAIVCKSPIKTFDKETETEYYARGYKTWLSCVSFHADSMHSFQEFGSRYMEQVKLLLQDELRNYAVPWLSAPTEYLQMEWNHFLAGTYGVCTRNGLPEQIATKELAAARVSEIVSCENLEQDTKAELQSVVDLLDSACSDFAPHELAGSSRQRLIDDVRQRFKLESNVRHCAN